jgi:transcriptional regulator with XRE-family HTH domain
MKQSHFGSRLGVGQGTVSAWERDDKDRAPSAEAYFRIAMLAPRPEDQAFFLQKAGLSREIIVSAANTLAGEQVVRPKEGEMVSIRHFLEGYEMRQEVLPTLTLPAWLVPNPVATRYFPIDEKSRGYGLESGDILLVEPRESPFQTIAPFWDQLVLIQFTDIHGTGEREQIVGRPFLTAFKGTGRVPVIECYGMLEPWNSLHYETQEAPGSGPFFYTRGDRLKRSSPFRIGVPTSRTLKFPRMETELDFNEQRELIRTYMIVAEEFNILGRVIAWFRAPSQGSK